MWFGNGMPAGHCDAAAYGVEEHMRKDHPASREIARCGQHGGPTWMDAVAAQSEHVDSTAKNGLKVTEGLAANEGKP